MLHRVTTANNIYLKNSLLSSLKYRFYQILNLQTGHKQYNKVWVLPKSTVERNLTSTTDVSGSFTLIKLKIAEFGRRERRREKKPRKAIK